MFPGTKNRKEGTFAKTTLCETALLFPLDFWCGRRFQGTILKIPLKMLSNSPAAPIFLKGIAAYRAKPPRRMPYRVPFRSPVLGVSGPKRGVITKGGLFHWRNL